MGDEKLLIVGLTRIVTSREVQNLHKSLRTICLFVILAVIKFKPKGMNIRQFFVQDLSDIINCFLGILL